MSKRVANKKIIFKVVGKHHKNCCAVKNEKSGYWNTCWGPIAYGKHGDPIVRTDRRYGKYGLKSTYWLRYVCNDTNCPAELHVDAESILSLVKS